VRSYLSSKKLDIYVLAGDRIVYSVKCNAMVFLIEYVVFVSGALIEVSGNSDASARGCFVEV
jgi:hypothetical protein